MSRKHRDMSSEETLTDLVLFSLEKRRLEVLLPIYTNTFEGWSKEDGARFF